jgi:hypothetical protein
MAMQQQQRHRRQRLILLLLAMPFLVASQCVVLFSSGDGSDDKDKEDDEVVITSGNGVLGSRPIAGVNYRSGAISGITNADGGFQYEPGQTVQFAIGDIALGAPASGRRLVELADLVPGSRADTAAVVNIERLLVSLDEDPEDSVITIPASAREQASRANEAVSAAIEFLDFADDNAFNNSASQLVAVLTNHYRYTAVLVDAATARARLSAAD